MSSRNINEKYTKEQLNKIIYNHYTFPETRFLLVANGVNNYIFTKIFKQKEITINEDFIEIKKKYSLLTRHFNDIILIEKLNEISGY